MLPRMLSRWSSRSPAAWRRIPKSVWLMGAMFLGLLGVLGFVLPLLPGTPFWVLGFWMVSTRTARGRLARWRLKRWWKIRRHHYPSLSRWVGAAEK